MTSRFNADEMIGRIVYQTFLAVRGSFWDESSGCMVTRANCENCARVFEEELGAAKVKILSLEPVLCLSCDNRAEARDITSVLVSVTARVHL